MPTRVPNNSGPNLTNATYIGRNVVKYGSIALVVLIVGRMLLSAFVAYWRAVNPPPPPAPTVGFGSLPKLSFPTQDSEDSPKSYRLETAVGNKLPEPATDRMKVFLMPKSSPSLLADQEAKARAATYGYIFEPDLLDSRTYRWTKSGALESSLESDLQNQNFVLKTNYLSRPELLSADDLPQEFEAVTKVKDFLDRTDLLPADIATSPGEVIFLKSLGGELEEAFSLSDADFLQINLDRGPIDETFELHNSDADKGVITAILAGVLSGFESIVDLEYKHNPIDYSEVETYPLRSIKSAWQTLQSGEGYIARRGTASDVVIRDVQLGYYEDPEEQEYMQPIYVFFGDEDFVGYVPAIDPRYIGSEQ